MNMDFMRSMGNHIEDGRKFGEGVDVFLLQEFMVWLHRIGKKGIHTIKKVGKPGGTAVGVAPGKKILSRGKPFLSLSTRGARMRLRKAPWVIVQVPGFGPVKFVSVHMPPLRYRRLLYKVYAWRIREIIRKSSRPVVFGGDWNWLIDNDPCNLRRDFKYKWIGQRIDGIAIPPELVPFIRDSNTFVPKGRKDKHAVVTVDLGPKKD